MSRKKIILLKLGLVTVYLIVAYIFNCFSIKSALIYYAILTLILFDKNCEKNYWKNTRFFYVTILICIIGLVMILIGKFLMSNNYLILIGAFLFSPMFSGLLIKEISESINYYKKIIFDKG